VLNQRTFSLHATWNIFDQRDIHLQSIRDALWLSGQRIFSSTWNTSSGHAASCNPARLQMQSYNELFFGASFYKWFIVHPMCFGTEKLTLLTRAHLDKETHAYAVWRHQATSHPATRKLVKLLGGSHLGPSAVYGTLSSHQQGLCSHNIHQLYWRFINHTTVFKQDSSMDFIALHMQLQVSINFWAITTGNMHHVTFCCKDVCNTRVLALIQLSSRECIVNTTSQCLHSTKVEIH